MSIDRRSFVTGACCGAVAVAAAGAALPLLSPSVSAGADAHQPAVLPAGADPAAYARERFLSHWNCTQAVLESLSGHAGMDAEALTRITTPFAAGMWNGLTCGAVTGAMMALGMRFGRASDGDGKATDVTKVKMRELAAAMRAQFGNLDCSALLGADMATDAGVSQAAGKGLFKSKCPLLVEAAVKEAAKLMST
ncbi:MAG: hypothetical protein FD177_1539 [Desulfovibrionaceae bacterium]|nr:MAG: hypothetical protein FD177_1539 [Desulfovibrionaceae bacterium]